MPEIMGFWGLHVVPGRVYHQVVDASFKLSMAALGEELVSDQRSSLKVNINKNEYILCSLIPAKLEQQPLNVVFTEGEEITFSVTGDNSIYLTGNYLPDSGDGEMDEDTYPYGYGLRDDDDGDDEDEEDPMSLLDESGMPLIKTRGAKRLAMIDMVDAEDDSDSDDENYVDGENDEDEEEEGDDEEDDDESEDDETKSLDKEIMAAITTAKKRNAKEKEPPTKKVKMDTDKRIGEDGKEEKVQQKTNGPRNLSPNNNVKGQVESAKKNQNMPGAVAEEKTKNEKNKKTKKKKDEKKTIAKSDEKTEKQQNEIMKEDDTKDDKGTSKKERKKDDTEDKATPQKEQKKENNDIKQSETPKSLRKELPNGLVIEDIKVGDGPKAKAGKRVGMRYIGKLTNDKIFDKNTGGAPFSFRLGAGEVIKGWDLGIVGMAVGGERRLIIPPELAYGAKGAPPDIPKNATLKFEVKLLSMK